MVPVVIAVAVLSAAEGGADLEACCLEGLASVTSTGLLPCVLNASGEGNGIAAACRATVAAEGAADGATGDESTAGADPRWWW